MRRRKRNTILRIALGLAIAAIVPTTALAKPVAGSQPRQVMELGLSEGKIKALGLLDDGTVGKSSDDRAVSRATPHGVEVASVAKSPDDRAVSRATPHGVEVASVAKSPDDRSFSKATSVDTTPVVSDDGRSIDVDPYTVTGFVLALLLAMGIGMGIAVWHSRKTKLSPA